MKGATRFDIFEYVADQYGTQPEYLWASDPNYAVLHRTDNRKWYGIIMDVSRKKLGLNGEGIIDILDIKCDPFGREILLQQPGFLPCYHLNKTHWIGVLLDGTVEKELLYQLLDESYLLTETKSKSPKHSK